MKNLFQKTIKIKGFTLIELLVVIAIIGLLVTIVMVSLNSARTKSRDAKRVADIKQIVLALEFYYDGHGFYPSYTALSARCNTSVNNSLQPLVTDGFLKIVPIDPSNINQAPNRLCYEYTSGSGATSWYCNGRQRTDYQYAFLFSTELADLPYSRLTDSSGNPVADYKYCITGPLK